MRGATRPPDTVIDRIYFNPRPSCEERPDGNVNISFSRTISTHAPHARSDSYRGQDVICFDISTHAPHARSDEIVTADNYYQFISTHAPHARSDSNENQKNNYHFLFFIYSSDFQLSIWAALLNNGISDW